MSGKPRVRFAPSPTGYLHIGGARTALFNWLYARRYGGTFVLRIEDTDRPGAPRPRSRPSSRGCAGWASTGTRARGGGDHGPYLQTQRLGTPRSRPTPPRGQGLPLLLHQGGARRPARGRPAAGEQFRYPGTCRDRNDDPDLPYVVRMEMPQRASPPSSTGSAATSPPPTRPSRTRSSSAWTGSPSTTLGGRGRRHDGHRPGGPGRRPHQQRRPANPDVPGAGLHRSPSSPTCPDDPGQRQGAALQAPRGGGRSPGTGTRATSPGPW